MWVYVIGTVALLVAAAFAWGVLRLRRNQEIACAAVRTVALADIEPLRIECERVFRSAFSESLDLDDLEGSARRLSDRIDDLTRFRQAFAREDFQWYFVLPVGAWVGELLRVHARAQWQVSGAGGLEMRIAVGDAGDFAITHPFDKVLKQVTIGDKGELYAYLMTASQLDAAIAESRVAAPM